MTKPGWLMLLNILDIIAKRLPHGGSDTDEEKKLRLMLTNLRAEVKRMPY